MSPSHAPGLLLRSIAILAFLLGVASAPAFAQDGIPCPAEPTNMAIAYGDVVTCAIQPFNDTDTFTFGGVAGEVVTIAATFVCFTLTAPSNSVVDACGSQVGRNRMDVVLSETGTFTVTTRLQPVGVIDYSLALERLIPAAGARAISYGGSLSDTINVAGDIDLFSFEASVNDTISIIVSASGSVQPCIELIAPNNTRSISCPNPTTNQLQVTLLQAGAYVILIRQGDNSPFLSAWTYSVQLTCTSGTCSTPPLPPSGLQGTVSAFTTTLVWTAPTTGRPPSSYVIEAGTASGGTNLLAFDTLSTSTTFIAPGVPNGTYFVRVRSKNSVGTSGPSNEITISGPTGCPLPSAPANFTAAATGLLASFQWAAANGNPLSYILEAGTTSGAANLAAVDLGLTTQFATLAPPGVYFVRVRGRNGCGLGPASNEATLIVGCQAAPSPPPNLTATVVGRVVTLSWPAAAGQPTSYLVEAGLSSGASNVANIDVGTLLTLSANAPPGTFFVRVRARNACGTSGPSIEQTVVVQ